MFDQTHKNNDLKIVRWIKYAAIFVLMETSRGCSERGDTQKFLAV